MANPFAATSVLIRAVVTDVGPSLPNGDRFVRVTIVDDDAILMIYGDPTLGVPDDTPDYRKIPRDKKPLPYFDAHPKRTFWVYGRFPRLSPFFVSHMHRCYATRTNVSQEFQIDTKEHPLLPGVRACRVIVQEQIFQHDFFPRMTDPESLCRLVAILGLSRAPHDPASKNTADPILYTLTKTRAAWNPTFAHAVQKFETRFKSAVTPSKTLTPEMYGPEMGRLIEEYDAVNTKRGYLAERETWKHMTNPPFVELILGTKMVDKLRTADPETYARLPSLVSDQRISAELFFMPLMSEKFFRALPRNPLTVEEDFVRVLPVHALAHGERDSNGLNINVPELEMSYDVLRYAQRITEFMCNSLRFYGASFFTIAQIMVRIGTLPSEFLSPAVVFNDLAAVIKGLSDAHLWSKAMSLLCGIPDSSLPLQALSITCLVHVPRSQGIYCLPYVDEARRAIVQYTLPIITQAEQARPNKRVLSALDQSERVAKQMAGMLDPIDPDVARLIQDPGTPCFLLFPYVAVPPTRFMLQLKSILNINHSSNSSSPEMGRSTNVSLLFSMDNWALRSHTHFGMSPFDIKTTLSDFERKNATTLAIVGAERLDLHTFHEILSACPSIKKIILAYAPVVPPSIDTRLFTPATMSNAIIYGHVVHDFLVSGCVRPEAELAVDTAQVDRTLAATLFLQKKKTHHLLTLSQLEIDVIASTDKSKLAEYSLNMLLADTDVQRVEPCLFVHAMGKNDMASSDAFTAFLESIKSVERYITAETAKDKAVFDSSFQCPWFHQLKRAAAHTPKTPIELLCIGDLVRLTNHRQEEDEVRDSGVPLMSAGIYRVAKIELTRRSDRAGARHPIDRLDPKQRYNYSYKVIPSAENTDHSTTTFSIVVTLDTIDGGRDMAKRLTHVISVWRDTRVIPIPFEYACVSPANNLGVFTRCKRMVFFYDHGTPYVAQKLMTALRHIGDRLDVILHGCTAKELAETLSSSDSVFRSGSVESHSPLVYELKYAHEVCGMAGNTYSMLGNKRQLLQG
jgi:hypothetical protein